MRQLDLFGAPEQPVTKPTVDTITVETPDAVIEVQTNPGLVAKEPEPVQQSEPQTEEPVEEVRIMPVATPDQPSTLIFDDGKIAVKIKPKKTPEVIADIAPVDSLAPPPPTIVTVTKKRGRKSLKDFDSEAEAPELPPDDELFSKQYYSISQVAKWFNVNNSLLRYWENEFDILKPRKNRKGDRLFRPEDIKNLQVIYYLLRQRKFTIEGAKDYLKNSKAEVGTNLRLINALTKFKTFLLELKVNLES